MTTEALTDGQSEPDRESLEELASLEPEDLVVALGRALPDADSEEVAVATFNSSI